MGRIVKTTTTVTTTEEGEIDASLLRSILGLPGGGRFKAWMDVPGGGDWSHEELEVGLQHSLHWSYAVTVETATEEGE